MWRFAPCIKGIRNPWNFCVWNPESGKFCLWNPESGKILLVKSGVRENFACESGIREKFACGIRNPESGKSLPSESGIREIFACGIRNPGKFCLWNPESGKFFLVESGILGFGIRITAQGIWNPTNDWNPESKSNWQRLESSTWNPESTGVESRIHDCLGFTCMGGEECGLVPVDGIPS